MDRRKPTPSEYALPGERTYDINHFVTTLHTKGFPTSERNLRHFAEIVSSTQGYPTGLLPRLAKLATWISPDTFYANLEKIEQVVGDLVDGEDYYFASDASDRKSGSGIWIYQQLLNSKSNNTLRPAKGILSQREILKASLLNQDELNQQFPDGTKILVVDDWAVKKSSQIQELLYFLPETCKATVVLMHTSKQARAEILRMPQVAQLVVVGEEIPTSADVLTPDDHRFIGSKLFSYRYRKWSNDEIQRIHNDNFALLGGWWMGPYDRTPRCFTGSETTKDEIELPALLSPTMRRAYRREGRHSPHLA